MQKFYSTRQAAQFLAELGVGISARTLEGLRVAGGGPTFTKAGPSKRARTFYRESDLLGWLDAGRRTSTSDRGAA